MKDTTTHNPAHYVDKERLYQELKVYHKNRKTNPDIRPSEYIGKCILLICEGLAKRPNFSGYTYKLDMVSDGIEDCCAAIKNFNPRKYNNPFGYFSQIAWWAFVQRILIEKKQQYLKHKNYQNNFMLADLTNTENNTIEKIAWSELSDNVIGSFENNLTKVKKSAILKNSKMEKKNVESKKSTYGAADSRLSRRRTTKGTKRTKRSGRTRSQGTNPGSNPGLL